MFNKFFLPAVFLLLGYGFLLSTEFKMIAAGVAIFLFGMMSLEEGFKTLTGGTLEKVLKASTNTTWKSMVFGILTTSVMQSSSLVSVITISFLSAGLLELASAIGIIFGANLGTTTGAWLVAGFGLKVNLSAFAMPMLVFGVILIFQKSKILRGSGYAFAGIGFLFLGIDFMKEGFESFSQDLDLAKYSMTGYEGVFVFTGIGILATVVMQSSHATLILTLAALAAQQVSYENALALAIGSNVGTTITAIIGSLGSGVNGRRLAVAHLIFNLVTGLIAIIGIYQLMSAVAWISAHIGIAADNYTLQLAVFHTLFNSIGIVIMLPLLNRLVAVLERFMPVVEPEIERPMYLNKNTMAMADAATEAVRKESIRLYNISVEVITSGLSVHSDVFQSKYKPKKTIRKSKDVIDEDIDDLYERKIKSLHGAIVEFVIHTRGGYADGRLKEELSELRKAGQHIVEAVKGVTHLKKNLVRFMKSDNASIKKEYNRLRRLIIRVLRELEKVQTANEADEPILALDQLKLEVEKVLEDSGNKLEQLIREDQVEVPMATSLMNDISYCRDICWDLIEAGAVLFSTSDSAQKAALRSIALDAHEIAGILESSDGKTE